MGGDSVVLDEGTMETAENERHHSKPDCYISVDVPLDRRSNFSTSSNIDIQYWYYLSAQNDVFLRILY